MGRVYAASDWHGCGSVGRKILDYLKPEDTLYFLGDAVDRGPDGAELLKLLLNRPNTYFIKGNHEDFIVRSDILHPSLTWMVNEGEKTFNDLSRDTDFFLYCQKRIKNMPTELRYNSPNGHIVILEHAGYTPTYFLSYLTSNDRYHDPLWDRLHFKDEWELKDKNIYVVHGHTCVQHLINFGFNGMENFSLTKEEYQSFSMKPTVIRYCDGHKFDIDLCTISTSRAVLLDLDTFEEIYFEGGLEKNV